MYRHFLYATAAAFTLFITPTQQAWAASDDELMAMVNSLKSQLETQQKQIDTLQKQLKENGKKIEATSKNSASAPSTANNVKIKLNPAPSFETADGATTFSMDGRVVTDVGFASNSNRDIGDGADIRYLWFGFKGTIEKDWEYRFLAGLEADETDVKDAYVAYNGFDGVSIMAGNFKEFNGIDNMSSNLHTTFLERSSAVTTFRPLRNLGLGTIFHDERWSLQMGAFRDDPGNTVSGDDEGYSFTGRIVGAPILNKSKNHILHLGAAARYRAPDSNLDSTSFNSRGESHVVDTRLINTGTISLVDHWETYSIEGLYTYGPFALQGEYNITEVDRNTMANPIFTGGYAQLSYFLTGDQRGYKIKTGTYDRVKVKNPFTLKGTGSGAWEVATRFSTLDLTDAGITGGSMDSYTLGVNWYPTDHIKFMANYVINKTDSHATSPNDEPHYLMFRAAVDF